MGKAVQKKMVVQCCVCKRLRGSTGRFRKQVLPEGVDVSHTYCPVCAEEARKRINFANSLLNRK